MKDTPRYTLKSCKNTSFSSGCGGRVVVGAGADAMEKDGTEDGFETTTEAKRRWQQHPRKDNIKTKILKKRKEKSTIYTYLRVRLAGSNHCGTSFHHIG